MTKFCIPRKNVIEFFKVKSGKKGAGLIPHESWFGAIWKQHSNWGTPGGFEAQGAVGRIPRRSVELTSKPVSTERVTSEALKRRDKGVRL